MDEQMLLMFADAIERKRLLRVTFTTRSGEERSRRCAPLDLAPSERAKIKFYKYHKWDLDIEPRPHFLSLSPEQVVQLEITTESFMPEQIVTWARKNPWTIIRDWGSLS
ncbi:hypothetical protein [Paenibacillus pini]|uniref:WYL domain-containing protein n=1 Tax=Paenibacillus pini JCM 16418 TaxID=1236976 RepID=W7YGA3_9BACL|nr:hypothetical protein [Paenibacillus pini]GAF09965.1 hypothetical protein JCM16418_4131 [Paenibacillus pini JCM 16418]